MPFGVVSEVGRGMCVLDRNVDRRRERDSFEGEFGASHCNQWGLRGVVAREQRVLPKLLWGDLLLLLMMMMMIVSPHRQHCKQC